MIESDSVGLSALGRSQKDDSLYENRKAHLFDTNVLFYYINKT